MMVVESNLWIIDLVITVSADSNFVLTEQAWAISRYSPQGNVIEDFSKTSKHLES